MNADPLKLLDEIGRQVTDREHAKLSQLFDREIAALLRKRRISLGLTQPQYAERAGRKKCNVVNVEIRGACPKIEDLYGAAKVLNPVSEDAAWILAADLLRQAAKRLLKPELTAAA